MGNLEQALDLGQGVYTQAEVNNKPSGFKNLIINGGFDVWQRGTSFSPTSGTYTADRWVVGYETATTLSVSRQSKLKGKGYYLRMNASDGQVEFVQRIEQVLESGKTYTISFSVRGETAKSNALRIVARQSKSGESNIYATIGDSTIDVTTSFVRFSTTITIPDGYEGGHTEFYFQQDSSFNHYNNNIDIADVQLEEGSVATPFEQRPYGLELSLCQRYYEKQSGSICYGSGFFEDTGYGKYYVKFEVEKRTSPSLLSSGGGTFAAYWTGTTSPASNSPTITYNGNKSCMIALSGGSYGTDGQGTNLTGYTSDAYLAFDAEL